MNKVLSILIMLLASQYANSATVICSGTVEELAYHANNKLMIRLSSMNTRVSYLPKRQNLLYRQCILMESKYQRAVEIGQIGHLQIFDFLRFNKER